MKKTIKKIIKKGKISAVLKEDICEQCKGTGRFPHSEITCAKCDGSGK